MARKVTSLSHHHWLPGYALEGVWVRNQSWELNPSNSVLDTDVLTVRLTVHNIQEASLTLSISEILKNKKKYYNGSYIIFATFSFSSSTRILPGFTDMEIHHIFDKMYLRQPGDTIISHVSLGQLHWMSLNDKIGPLLCLCAVVLLQLSPQNGFLRLLRPSILRTCLVQKINVRAALHTVRLAACQTLTSIHLSFTSRTNGHLG